MQVTDEMVERGLRITLSSVNLPAGECLHTTDVREILTAALSDQERAVEVKHSEWHRSDRPGGGSVMLYTLREEGRRRGKPVMTNDVMISIDRGTGSSTDIEPIVQRIRSALVAVPVEPVAKQWCAYEDGQQHTSWYPDGYGDRAGWEALAKRNPAKYQVVTRDLFTSPPLSREGEDSAEVIEKMARAMCERDGADWDAIDCNHTANGEEPEEQRGYWRDKADAALATTRSGSATTQKGCSE